MYTVVVSRTAARPPYRPPRSVRAEPTGDPPRSDTWCSTAHAPATGVESAPVTETTRPDTRKPWATSSAGWNPRARIAAARALRRELPEVFRIEVLEVVLELLRVPRLGARLLSGGIHRRQLQQVLLGEDRCLEPQRHGDAVRRAGVDLDHVILAVDVELGVVGVLLDLGDEHMPEISTQADDDLFHEVVREGSGELHAGQLHGDGARLRRPDPDGQPPLALFLLEDDHRRVGRPVEPQMGHPNLDHDLLRYLPPMMPDTSAAPA